MERLDGNSIAGELFEHFGVEMTAAIGTCGTCGTQSQIAELVVYGRPPGAIVRCGTCGNVVIAVVNARRRTLFNFDKFNLREPPGSV
jgi:bacterioferritin-associated ferredoxin